ncbi:MAG: hypothetical protein KAT49_06540 [Methanomicrobia archaeon]|nr:hypothetical protein [Methanomicrobia archaeon]
MGKEIKPIVIRTQEELINAKESINNQLKNNKELIEFIKKYWGGSEEEIKKYVVLDDEYIKDLTEALEEGYWLCGFIYPEYLYEKEEFILKIEFDEELNETQKNKFYMNWLVWCIGVTEIENFNHIYFVLPEDAYPWYYNTKDDPFKEKGRNVLLWKIQEIPKTNEGNILIVATFGTLEERLHWENHVNNVENFIYIIAGILLTIILAISFADFGRYRWIKYIALILVLTVFRILFTERIDNFDLEELPIETCLGGECLIGTVDSISKILLIGQIVLVLTFLFLIFRFLRNRTEERSEQEVENGDHGVELEEEVTEGTQELKGVSEEEQGLGEEIETVETKEVTKKKEEHRGEVTEEKSKSEKKEGKLNKRKKEMNRK